MLDALESQEEEELGKFNREADFNQQVKRKIIKNQINKEGKEMRIMMVSEKYRDVLTNHDGLVFDTFFVSNSFSSSSIHSIHALL